MLKRLALFIILIGVFGVAINMLFGYNTVAFLEKYRIEGGLWLYKIDTFGYMQKLQNSFTDTAVLKLDLPWRTWHNLDADNVIDNLTRLGWNLQLMVDYIIFILNIIIYPIRLGSYIIRNILAVLGIRVTGAEQSGLYWLIQLVNAMGMVKIPYLPA